MRGLLVYISILASIVVFLVILGVRGFGAPEVTNNYPSDENNFISIVSSAKEKNSSANELQQPSIKKERNVNLCGLLPRKNNISNWFGQITDISSTSSGNAILSIKLPDGTLIETWNNSLSDIGDYTIIKKGSSVYNELYSLSKGDSVNFSGAFVKKGGECAKEISMTIDGSLSSPEFLFKFSSLAKA